MASRWVMFAVGYMAAIKLAVALLRRLAMGWYGHRASFSLIF
jgi:hypothetical protein